MKKNTIKAFTLVEMLIVIVIIGILIASLMPRMQSAQGRARDVARKNDLSQIQTAIITSQQDKRVWPSLETARGGTPVSTIEQALKDAGMTQVPTDPNGSNSFSGLGDTLVSDGQYGYMVTTRNSVADGGFVLMAKTEVEGSSNWVTCISGSDSSNKTNNMKTYGKFTSGVDLRDVVLCSTFTKSTSECKMETGACTYTDDAELRYILVY